LSHLPLTGERTVPEIPAENYWYRRHEVVYEWVAKRWLPAGDAPHRSIVDAGSGEGYGAALLARANESAGSSAAVIGLELDAGAAQHATRNYDRISVVRSNLDALPVATSSIGLLVSLQVVEHLWDLAGFLAQCRRVLDDAGVAVISTPNRLTFSPGLGRGQRPTNPFHVEEFDVDQVRDLLLAAGFSAVRCYGLHHGPRITQWEHQHGSIVDAQIRAALDPQRIDSWIANTLGEFVESVAVSDFDISERALDEAQDLIVIGEVSTIS